MESEHVDDLTVHQAAALVHPILQEDNTARCVEELLVIKLEALMDLTILQLTQSIHTMSMELVLLMEHHVITSGHLLLV